MQQLVSATYPKELKLRDQTEVTLTPMVPSDWQLVGDFLSAIHPDDRLFLRHDISDPEIVERWCTELDYKHVFPLLAWVDGRVVADGTLNQDPGLWTAHLGRLRVLVHPEFRRRGLGELITDELIAVATAQGLNKAVVECASEQKDLIEFLGEKGFRQAARLEGFVKDRNGKDHAMIIMVRELAGGRATQ
jgi:ribosomal protein S18 acetylase RimI-like enzyme